jgi:2-polyprenyl-3-methyl-5-hydroxy-6-metoxy-1,4-benzoquinol methylase
MAHIRKSEHGYWSAGAAKEWILGAMRESLWNDDHWERVLVPLLRIPAGGHVLDVGCGLGFVGTRLAKTSRLGRCEGIDLDPSLIAEATGRAKRDDLDARLGYQVGDAESIPFGDQVFDCAICQTVLMHAQHPETVVAQMRRVVRPGGQVVAIEPAGDVRFDSAREASLVSSEQAAKHAVWRAYLERGGARTGHGDSEIGRRVPVLFHQAGLVIESLRMMDVVKWLLPPYDRPSDRALLARLGMPVDDYMDTLAAAGVAEDFRAGGGSTAELAELWAQERHEWLLRQHQIRDGTYMTVIAQPVVCAIARR